MVLKCLKMWQLEPALVMCQIVLNKYGDQLISIHRTQDFGWSDIA